MTKNVLRWSIFCVVACALSGCAPKINEPNDALPSAQARFIHVASTAGNLDFAVMNVAGATLLYVQRETEYGRQYRYDVFKAGEREFRALRSRANANLARAKRTLEANAKYTAFAIDAANAVDTLLLVAMDTTATPAADKAFVRFVHASGDAGEVSISGDGVSLSNFKRRDVSRYFVVDAGTRSFAIQFSDGATATTTQTFFPKGVYTVVISGSRAGGAGQVPLNVKSFLDASP
ncbi:MAG: DUF4397 domain-containing protein [Chloroherpetonaceae bacterium]|nr:DUF4397 domain-containing protein [Chloroherpetonaceae bacterium]